MTQLICPCTFYYTEARIFSCADVWYPLPNNQTLLLLPLHSKWLSTMQSMYLLKMWVLDQTPPTIFQLFSFLKNFKSLTFPKCLPQLEDFNHSLPHWTSLNRVHFILWKCKTFNYFRNIKKVNSSPLKICFFSLYFLSLLRRLRFIL